MTITKAKLFQTARIREDAHELPEGFYPGEYVAVRFISKGAFGLNFQISHGRKFNDSAVVDEHSLENFCL